ncbi:hypothetical protein [Agarivorans sp. 1_MG-2023]|uniref:hypothetical protein n=1 Tax=Agarivorans sp. 1_MG-2023 TaxID=3062634 RepID=UPI0026E247DA|nr:hypothetical protein [Agarivorans sp. 1_MG-2023]MDO6763696.1 hypothetical protein [Agarivorans sp. 1_MG-2023]
MKWNFLISSLIAVGLLTGCGDMNDKNGSAKDSIEFSQSADELARFMNLDGLQIESVKWATGSTVRGETEGMLATSNDWWVDAVLTFPSGQDISEITKDCEFRYSLAEIDNAFIDETVKKLTNNPEFVSKTPMEVQDACRFKSDVLSNGVLVKDTENNQILVKLFTN